jgi:hypothetical protein
MAARPCCANQVVAWVKSEEFVLRREVQVEALAGDAGGAREIVHRRLAATPSKAVV